MRLAVACSFCALAACATILGIDDGTPRSDAGQDAIAPDASDASDAAAPACDLDAAFSAPVAITELNSAADDYQARLTADELVVYFQRTTADAGYEILTATRPSATSTWGAPTALASIDTPADETDPFITSDDLRLFFASDRGGGLGSLDLWQAERDASTSAFGLVAPIANVSSTSNDSSPYYVPGALYFHSDRGSGGLDLYRAAEESGGFAAPLLISELSSQAQDAFIVVSTNELRTWFASQRDDAGTTWRAYASTRAVANAPWNTPVLVPEFANVANVLPSWISPDGCRLYLSDNASGNYDIYASSR